MRSAVDSALSEAGDASSEERNSRLRGRLDAVVEDRLAAVYEQHLATLVARTKPMLLDLIARLPSSAADLDHASFLFEMALPFPQPSYYALPTATKGLMNGSKDPFEGFSEKVVHRVDGRSPLIDQGIREIEGHAKALRQDLEGWLGATSGDGTVGTPWSKLRQTYIRSATETLEGIVGATLALLDETSVSGEIVPLSSLCAGLMSDDSFRYRGFSVPW